MDKSKAVKCPHCGSGIVIKLKHTGDTAGGYQCRNCRTGFIIEPKGGDK